MENVPKYFIAFLLQILALYFYWLFFFGSKNIPVSSLMVGDSKSPLEYGLTVLQITCPTEELAKKLSHGLVSKNLAACVNIIPKVTSIYSWDGTTEEDNEVLMIVKTKISIVGKVVQFVKSMHPYEVPEVISLPIQDGNHDYLQWVAGAVRGN